MTRGEVGDPTTTKGTWPGTPEKAPGTQKDQGGWTDGSREEEYPPPHPLELGGKGQGHQGGTKGTRKQGMQG